jgi:hypothetical protein
MPSHAYDDGLTPNKLHAQGMVCRGRSSWNIILRREPVLARTSMEVT